MKYWPTRAFPITEMKYWPIRAFPITGSEATLWPQLLWPLKRQARNPAYICLSAQPFAHQKTEHQFSYAQHRSMLVHCSTLVQHTIRYDGCNGGQSSSSDQPSLPSGSQSGQAYFATGPHMPCAKNGTSLKGSLQKNMDIFDGICHEGGGGLTCHSFSFQKC